MWFHLVFKAVTKIARKIMQLFIQLFEVNDSKVVHRIGRHGPTLITLVSSLI
jgi:hypothetical protein